MDVLGVKVLRVHDRAWVQQLRFSLSDSCLTEFEILISFVNT